MKFIALLLIGSFVLAGCSSFDSYEGMSAEEWYEEYADADDNYQKLKDCVESYSYYYGSEDYGELQSQLDDVQNCL